MAADTTHVPAEIAVSVIVPVFNTEKFLRPALDSIAGQTLQKIEIICVDDGSTDASPQILDEFAARDPRAKILRRKHLFAGVARNSGMKIARGKYLCFLDSDDVFAPEMLEKMVARADATDADIVCCDFTTHHDDGSKPDFITQVCVGPKFGKFRDGNAFSFLDSDVNVDALNIVVWNKIFRREFVAGTPQLTFSATRSSNDVAFVWTALALAKRIAVVPEVLLTHFRTRAGSISLDRGEHQLDCLNAYVEIDKRLKSAGVYERVRSRVLVSRMWSFKHELDLNPNEAFLRKIYKTFPETSGSVRSFLEIAAFGKELSRSERKTVMTTKKDGGAGTTSVASFDSHRYPPRILVRLAAMFIPNKAARKRFRERHMDLNPRDGIDIWMHPEMRRDSVLKRFAVRFAAMFILNKTARKRFRERHLNLTPRDGIDINARSRRAGPKNVKAPEKKPGFSRRIFNSLVPVTRSKIEHVERHISRDIEARTKATLNRLLAEIRAERTRIDGGIRLLVALSKTVDGTRNELSSARGEISAARAGLSNELSGTREALEKEIASAREELSGTRDEIATLSKTVDGTRNELSSARKELAAARKEIAETAKALTAALDELRANANALAAVRKEAVATRDELAKKFAGVAGAQTQTQRALSRGFSDVNAGLSGVAATAAGIRLDVDGSLPRKIQDWYFSKTKRPLNLDAPKTYCEKVQWLKAYDVTPKKTQLADKLAVREWVAAQVGEKYVVPVLGVWNSFDEIDFSALPQQFVLKATHGSRYNIVVKNKAELDFADAKKKFDAWLAQGYELRYGYEMHYAGIPPRIIAEPWLDIDESGAYDWSVFCFNGKPGFYMAVVGGAHAADHGTRLFYDLDWKKLPFARLRPSVPTEELSRPENLDEMRGVAEKLCRGFFHVCVDFFRLRDGSWRFAEMTFTRASGLMEVTPYQFNRWIGDKLHLPTDEPAQNAPGADAAGTVAGGNGRRRKAKQ